MGNSFLLSKPDTVKCEYALSPQTLHISYFSNNQVSYKKRKQWEEEGFILALGLRIHSPSWQIGMVAEAEAAGLMETAVRKLREMNYWVQFTVSFYLCIWVSVEARRGCQVPWSWRSRQLRAAP